MGSGESRILVRVRVRARPNCRDTRQIATTSVVVNDNTVSSCSHDIVKDSSLVTHLSFTPERIVVIIKAAWFVAESVKERETVYRVVLEGIVVSTFM